MHHPTDRIVHTTAFVKPVVAHWLEREIAQWVHPMKDRSDDPSHHEIIFHIPLLLVMAIFIKSLHVCYDVVFLKSDCLANWSSTGSVPGYDIE